MCNINPNYSPSVLDKKYRLADFFNQHWANYLQHPKEPITEEQFKAVNMMRLCRTPALGKDIYSCPDCDDVTEVYHSCKNRFCPTCSWQDTVKWAEKINNRMLASKHRHVVMTLPHELNDLIKSNNELLLDVLLRVSSETITDWMHHKHSVTPGVISVLHTFGETKNYHPHVHMIVSWGGLDSQNKQKEIKGDFVNYDFIKKKFRLKFEDALVGCYNNNSLTHRFKDRKDFFRFLKRVNEKRWVVHMEPTMANPAHVVRYIGRYSKRACLSEYKITRMEGDFIGFKYKDYKTVDKKGKAVEKELVLHYRDFFPRLLQHVPPKRFRMVRYYGLYSNKGYIPEQYRNTKKIESPEKWENIQEEVTGENPLICKKCNKRKSYDYTISRRRQEPSVRIYVRKELVREFDLMKNVA